MKSVLGGSEAKNLMSSSHCASIAATARAAVAAPGSCGAGFAAAPGPR